MKIQIKALACLWLSMVPLLADEPTRPAAPSNPDFNLQIQANHDSYFGGEPIILTVTLTNKSDRTRDVGVFGPKAEWMVKGQDGKPVALTAQGNTKSVRRALVSQKIESGQSIAYKVVINRFCDMTAADNYEISGQRWPIAENRTAGEVTGALITSNSVKVSVAEDDVRVEKGK